MHQTATAERKYASRLVSGEQLLEAIFDEIGRPSPRWLRYQMAARTIPYVKLGRRVFFDVEEVRDVLSSRYTIRSNAKRHFRKARHSPGGKVAVDQHLNLQKFTSVAKIGASNSISGNIV